MKAAAPVPRRFRRIASCLLALALSSRPITIRAMIFRALLLGVVVITASAGEAEPDIPDPYGLGKRLALMAHLREEMKRDPPPGATYEDLLTMYRAATAGPTVKPEDEARAVAEWRARTEAARLAAEAKQLAEWKAAAAKLAAEHAVAAEQIAEANARAKERNTKAKEEEEAKREAERQARIEFNRQWQEAEDRRKAEKEKERQAATAAMRAGMELAKVVNAKIDKEDASAFADFMERHWLTPATIQRIDWKPVFRDDHRRICFAVFDSQNVGGATVRTRALFCYANDLDGSSWIQTSDRVWLQNCSDPPKDDEIEHAIATGFPDLTKANAEIRAKRPPPTAKP